MSDTTYNFIEQYATMQIKVKTALVAVMEHGSGLILIEGSRGSAKSYSGSMAVHQLLYWGYADEATAGLIVEKKLSDSIIELNEIVAGDLLADSPRNNETWLENGSSIHYQGFHPSRKTALKGGIKGAKIVLIDEVEAWLEKAGMDTLNTYIRAGGIIILISNKFPEYIREFGRAYQKAGGKYFDLRIDYWENEYLDPITRATWDALKEENYALWLASVVYEDTDEYTRLLSPAEIESMFADCDTDCEPLNRSIGVDVSTGTASDHSVISRAILGDNGEVYVFIGNGLKVDAPNLTNRVRMEVNEFKPNSEVWDCDGIGKSVAQMYGLHDRLIEFHGNGAGEGIYGNKRTAAYGYIEELARVDKLHLFGSQTVLARVREDFRAQFLAKDNAQGKMRLAEKEQIKKVLGRSPDYSDSVVMAVWGLKFNLQKVNDFHTMGKRKIKNTQKGSKPSWLKI